MINTSYFFWLFLFTFSITLPHITSHSYATWVHNFNAAEKAGDLATAAHNFILLQGAYNYDKQDSKYIGTIVQQLHITSPAQWISKLADQLNDLRELHITFANPKILTATMQQIETRIADADKAAIAGSTAIASWEGIAPGSRAPIFVQLNGAIKSLLLSLTALPPLTKILNDLAKIPAAHAQKTGLTSAWIAKRVKRVAELTQTLATFNQTLAEWDVELSVLNKEREERRIRLEQQRGVWQPLPPREPEKANPYL